MIAIVDYGMGNLASVQKAFSYINYESCITNDKQVLANASGVVLPGVGAYAPAMEALKSQGLDVVLKDIVNQNKPFLGICLGMQLLFDGSEEGSEDGELIDGLGIIPGRVVRFPKDKTVDVGLKVPQMDWNSLEDTTGSSFTGGGYVYFAHSYYCIPSRKEDVAANTTYGVKYCVSVEKNNIFATQFHPEKSGSVGLSMLTRFARRT